MLDQVGPHKLFAELRDQAPRYAKILPELPRMVHGFLRRGPRETDRDLGELLLELKRTNRLLQGIVYCAIGFALGLVVMQLLVRGHLF